MADVGWSITQTTVTGTVNKEIFTAAISRVITLSGLFAIFFSVYASVVDAYYYVLCDLLFTNCNKVLFLGMDFMNTDPINRHLVL